MDLQTPSSAKIYRLTKPKRVYAIILACLFILLTVANIILLWVSTPGNNLTLVVRICLVVEFLLLACISLYDAKHNRLVVSHQGIEYYNRFACSYAGWDNVGIVGLKTNNPSLTLRQPIVKVKRWLRWTSLSANIIPLNSFGNWQKNGLKQDIKYYAPYLLKDIMDSPETGDD